MTCKKCGAKMAFKAKDTFSGDEIREYECSRCGHDDWERGGVALWKLIQDADKPEE
jgi:DNA-directed RNA polymerase subunit RPC12/RpoP